MITLQETEHRVVVSPNWWAHVEHLARRYVEDLLSSPGWRARTLRRRMRARARLLGELHGRGALIGYGLGADGARTTEGVLVNLAGVPVRMSPRGAQGLLDFERGPERWPTWKG